MYPLLFKPMSDFLISLLLLVVLSPVIILVIIVLSVVNKGNPFFLQQRPGKKNKMFYIIKFKTMNDKKDSQGVLLADENRLTLIGKFIRKTSLDEIPQLINVLIGQMALIGPRPLLPEYLPLYNNFQKQRHNVKPGITGWAQVNGRNAISWSEKFNFDVWYVQNISLRLDIRIMLLTLKKVFKSEGINSNNSATMEPFKGE